MLFYQGGQRQPEAVFQLCPVTHKSQYFPIGSWVLTKNIPTGNIAV